MHPSVDLILFRRKEKQRAMRVRTWSFHLPKYVGGRSDARLPNGRSDARLPNGLSDARLPLNGRSDAR